MDRQLLYTFSLTQPVKKLLPLLDVDQLRKYQAGMLSQGSWPRLQQEFVHCKINNTV